MSGLIAEAQAGTQTDTAWLLPVQGPALEALQLPGSAAGVVLGRGDSAQLRLPLNADKVSRAHCKFTYVDGQWYLSDASRWGTFVNGLKLQSGVPVALRDGDAVRVVPWTFTFSFAPPRTRGQELDDDTTATNDVRSVDDNSARLLAANMVDLLTQSTERIHAAGNEKELAEALIEVALRGTGLTNAAVLKVVDGSGRVEAIASRMAAGTTGQPLFSPSQVARARLGQVAELRVDSMTGSVGESVMQMKISAAICAPLLIGEGGAPASEKEVSALLYLDARQGAVANPPKPSPNAAGFVMALARMGSMSLANIKRMEMTVRIRETESDLKAAAEAQRLIFPPREGRAGPFSYHGESRPGQSVGGDFFDVVHVAPGKLAVALGDVAGKGIPASVLMTASFGFLHSLLESGYDLGKTADMLSRFIHPRRTASRFVTLWIGVFDVEKKELTYVDCGHGWAGMQLPDGTFMGLDSGGGPPLPINLDYDCNHSPVTVPLPEGGRAVIVSDGIVEQLGVTVDEAGKVIRDQFGMPGVKKSLGSKPPAAGSAAVDDLKAIFDGVVSFAGTTQLSDDATAILVRWD